MIKTTQEVLSWAQHRLESAGINTARLDALVLIEDITGIDRAKILAESHIQLTADQFSNVKRAVLRRSRHIPLAYVRQKTEFYGRDFFVDSRVLEPRPESESIIEELLELCRDKNDACHVIEVGTGSGALIITAKLELPRCSAIATDIDKNCLDVARINAERYACRIQFTNSDLIARLNDADFKSPCIIIANLPYVPDSWQINRSAAHEPKTAIFGGQTGLELYERLFCQIDKLPTKPDHIITESMPPQHKDLAEIALSHNYELDKTNDFIQVFSLAQRQV